MIELARYRCPQCSAVIDVWLEDGYPEEIESTRCPFCTTESMEPVYCQFDQEETDFYGGPETPMDPTELRELQVVEESGGARWEDDGGNW